MKASDIREIDRAARERFSYLTEDGDTWRSHADEVLKGEAWHGDCDDLASTVLDMLGRQGVPKEDRYRLIVSAAKTKKPDHMLGCVCDEDGGWWLIGDTFGLASAAKNMQHRPVVYNCLSETIPDAIWREGVPWKADQG